jgi:hypothetical protein
MTRTLAYWLLLEALFVTILIIAIFFLDDPVTRVFLGLAGALGAIFSIVMIARVRAGKARN